MNRHAHLPGGVEEGRCSGMRVTRPSNVNRPSHTSPLIRTALPIFLALEDGKDVFKGPALRAILSPAIVITLHTTCPNHGVDACSPAEYMAERHVELAIVQLRQRRERKVV